LGSNPNEGKAKKQKYEYKPFQTRNKKRFCRFRVHHNYCLAPVAWRKIFGQKAGQFHDACGYAASACSISRHNRLTRFWKTRYVIFK
jgi:hypothetical protein